MTTEEAEEVIRDLTWIREAIIRDMRYQGLARIEELITDYTERFCPPVINGERHVPAQS